MTRVTILGGGPAGVGGAWRLKHVDPAHEVVLFERNEHFGGNSGSFDHGAHRLDFGSHRLHPACEPRILDDVRALLGDELLDRPRHGRIRLRGRWVRFPLRAADLALHCDKGFVAGTVRDALVRALPGGRSDGDTFASVLSANLGPTICEHFYFPYARKLWGREPRELSAIQARKRVSAGSFGKLVRKLLPRRAGAAGKGSRRFYYPRGGFGRISEVLAEDAAARGADLRLGWTVEAVERAGDAWRVRATRGTETCEVESEHLWSTLPLTLLARMLRPAPPAELLEAARRIDYRAMVLVYLELPVARFSEFDAHYFPGADVSITRLSEPKNYAARTEPADATVLCAELPCARDDAAWSASDAELGALVARDLEHSGLALPAAPRAVFSRRLPQAYPIYDRGYETALEPLEAWLSDLPGLLTYGRQGLFAHDNTHHALAMAYAAAECVRGDSFDEALWSSHRAIFAEHVVED